MSHTPGPWKIDRSFPRRLPFGISQVNEPHQAVLTTQAFCRKTTDGGEANARLIAAAPTLLEAAERSLELIEKGAPGWGVAKDLLRAAIKEARGA